MKVLPLDHETPDDVDQYVKLVFELPVVPEKCKESAHYLAHVAAERLAFHGRLVRERGEDHFYFLISSKRTQ